MIFLLVQIPLGGQRSATATEQHHLKPVGVITQLQFFFLTCCLHRICFMIRFFICLFPNSSFSGHSRNPPVSLFNYGFSCMHGQKYIRDTALRHEVNLKAGPKISQESQRALQEYFQHPRHASPRGLSCTAGSNRF